MDIKYPNPFACKNVPDVETPRPVVYHTSSPNDVSLHPVIAWK